FLSNKMLESVSNFDELQRKQESINNNIIRLTNICDNLNKNDKMNLSKSKIKEILNNLKKEILLIKAKENSLENKNFLLKSEIKDLNFEIDNLTLSIKDKTLNNNNNNNNN